MNSARSIATVSIASGLVWAFSATAFGMTQPSEPAEPPPTAIEEAIIEHGCGALRPDGALETDAYLACRQNELHTLRTEFGRDLRRLSNSERRTIDSACSGLRAPRGQDAYVECLTAQLTTLRRHGSRAKADTAAAAAASPGAAIAPAAIAAEAALPPPAPASRSYGLWIGVALVALVAAGAGGTFVMSRSRRRASFACRSCGIELIEQGDLCQA
ncbi:MAG: hypothetical protein ACRD2I_26130, partial [Vicinamibacterales bacterium]